MLFSDCIFHIINCHHQLDFVEGFIGLCLILLVQHGQIVIHLDCSLAVLILTRCTNPLSQGNNLRILVEDVTCLFNGIVLLLRLD